MYTRKNQSAAVTPQCLAKTDTLQNFKISVNREHYLEQAACIWRRGEQPPIMDATYSDLWVQAIKEVLAEDGKPPLSADDEKLVRADVEQMNVARELSVQTAARSNV